MNNNPQDFQKKIFDSVYPSRIALLPGLQNLFNTFAELEFKLNGLEIYNAMQTLGLTDSKEINDKTLKAAFRKKSLVAHPDKPTGSEALFNKVKAAQELLSNTLKDKGRIEAESIHQGLDKYKSFINLYISQTNSLIIQLEADKDGLRFRKKFFIDSLKHLNSKAINIKNALYKINTEQEDQEQLERDINEVFEEFKNLKGETVTVISIANLPTNHNPALLRIGITLSIATVMLLLNRNNSFSVNKEAMLWLSALCLNNEILKIASTRVTQNNAQYFIGYTALSTLLTAGFALKAFFAPSALELQNPALQLLFFAACASIANPLSNSLFKPEQDLFYCEHSSVSTNTKSMLTQTALLTCGALFTIAMTSDLCKSEILCNNKYKAMLTLLLIPVVCNKLIPNAEGRTNAWYAKTGLATCAIAAALYATGSHTAIINVAKDITNFPTFAEGIKQCANRVAALAA